MEVYCGQDGDYYQRMHQASQGTRVDVKFLIKYPLGDLIFIFAVGRLEHQCLSAQPPGICFQLCIYVFEIKEGASLDVHT
jgi:hypothetical protein